MPCMMCKHILWMWAWHVLLGCNLPSSPAPFYLLLLTVDCLNLLCVFFFFISMPTIKLYHSSWQIAAAHVTEVEPSPCYNSKLTVMLVWVSWLGGIYHRISLVYTLQGEPVISLLCLSLCPSSGHPSIPASIHSSAPLTLIHLSRTPIFHLPVPESSPPTSPELPARPLSFSLPGFVSLSVNSVSPVELDNQLFFS